MSTWITVLGSTRLIRWPMVRRSTAERGADQAELRGFSNGRAFERMNGPDDPERRPVELYLV